MLIITDNRSSTKQVSYNNYKRSQTSHKLVLPSYRTSSYERQAFSVAGPITWTIT